LKSRLGSDLIEVEVPAGDLDRTAAVLHDIGCGKATIDPVGSRITIPVCDPVSDLMAALRVLDKAGITPQDLGLRRPSLDDVFLTLTGRTTVDEDPADPPAAGRRARERAGSQA
jgi:ABC-2 type transport system ATP-binding protein